MLNSRQSLAIILLSVALGLILPFLVQHGMFMDGTQYAVVSRNLAEGFGSFWFPSLSPTWYRAGSGFFMEQPPLFYFLESQLFTLFGNSIFAERTFCFLCLAATIILIDRFWRDLFLSKPELRSWGFLPAFLFLVTPVVFWSYRNNMIEMLLTVMILAATTFILRGISARSIPALILGAIFILLGALTKGLPALFPFAMPLCWYVFYRQEFPLRKALITTFTLIAFFALPLVILLLLSPEARESLSFYFFHRVLARLSDEPVVSNRFSSMLWLAADLLVMVLMVVISIFLLRKQYRPDYTTKSVWIVALYGLCGVVPLLLTQVQRAFYLVPAIPFFAVAAAAVIAPGLNSIFVALSNKTANALRVAAIISTLALATITLVKFGDTSRDSEILRDVHSIASIVGGQTSLVTGYDVYSRWDLNFYLLRYHRIPLGSTHDSLAQFYLANKNSPCPNNYEECGEKLFTLQLCCRNQEAKEE